MWECVDLFRAGTGALGDGRQEPDAPVFSAWNDGATGNVRLARLDAWRMDGIFAGTRPLFP